MKRAADSAILVVTMKVLSSVLGVVCTGSATIRPMLIQPRGSCRRLGLLVEAGAPHSPVLGTDLFQSQAGADQEREHATLALVCHSVKLFTQLRWQQQSRTAENTRPHAPYFCSETSREKSWVTETARMKRIHEGKGKEHQALWRGEKGKSKKGSRSSSMSNERMEEDFEKLVKQMEEAENNKRRHGNRIQNQQIIGGNHRQK